MTSKKSARVCFALFLVCLLGMCFFPVMGAGARSVEYEIIFRTGAHGTFDGIEGSSVSYAVAYEAAFPDVPDVTAESGYVFKGWSEELPPVGSPVTGKQVFVAKYGVLVSGQEYKVSYVDEYGSDLLTAKVKLTESGATVSERARSVEGYTPLETQKNLVVTADQNAITFVYRSDRVASSASSENPGQGNASGAVSPPSNNAPAGAQSQLPAESGAQSGETVSVPEEEVPLASSPVNIEDEEVPKGDGLQSDSSAGGNLFPIIAAGTAVLVAAGALLVFLVKRKQKKQDS